MSRWLVLLVTLIPAARLALDLARRFRRQLEREEAGAPPEEGRARYGVLLHGASLPAVIGLWLLLRAVVSPQQLEQALISLFFLLTVSLTLHTLLLLPLLLLAVGGRCVLAYDRVSGEEALFGGDAAAFRTRLVLWEEDGVEQILRVTDEAAFHRWFADLSLRPLTGSYSLYTGEDQLYFLPDGPKGTGTVVVSEGYLKAEGPELFPLTLCYLLPEGVDWRELRPLLGPFEVRAEATAGE